MDTIYSHIYGSISLLPDKYPYLKEEHRHHIHIIANTICKKFKFCNKMSLRAVTAVDKLITAGGGVTMSAEQKTGYISDGLRYIQEQVTQKRCKEKISIDDELVGKWETRHYFLLGP